MKSELLLLLLSLFILSSSPITFRTVLPEGDFRENDISDFCEPLRPEALMYPKWSAHGQL